MFSGHCKNETAFHILVWRSGWKERKKRSGRQDSREDTADLSPGWFAAAAFLEFPTDRQNISLIPCPNFGESRFPGSSQIPLPLQDILRFSESRSVFYSNPRSRKYLACSAGVYFGRTNVLIAKTPCQKLETRGEWWGESKEGTNFSAKYQLTTIFWPILS